MQEEREQEMRLSPFGVKAAYELWNEGRTMLSRVLLVDRLMSPD